MRRVLFLTIVVLLAFGGALAVGCGGDSTAGEYKWKSGDESLKDMTVTLADDGTLTFAGTVPGLEGDLSFDGTWTQDGSEVTLEFKAFDETQTQVGEYKDGELVFDEVVWVKQ